MGTHLCDLSSSGVLRIAGDDAAAFLKTMTSVDIDACEELLSVHEGLVLNGEGCIVDAVEIVRSGTAEYLVVASEENTAELFEWLDAHATISDERGAVFPDLDIDNASERIALLMIFGEHANEAFSRVLEACEGRVAVIGCTYTQAGMYGIPPLPAHLLVAPVNAASAIGDFLLDACEADVWSLEEYVEELSRANAYEKRLYEAAYVKPGQVGLEHLLRPGGGFVGARALESS